jgi:hypothetical protein
MEKYLLIGLTYLVFWPSLLIFGLKLFRFRLKPFVPHIAFATLLLSQLSYLLQTTNLMYMMAIIQFLALWLAFWLILRIQVQYALLMALFSFITETITEIVVNSLVPATSIAEVTEENMVRFFLSGVFICLFPLAYTMILHATRLGFSFIPQSKKPKRIHFTGNFWVNAAIVTAIVIFFLGSFIFFFYPWALILEMIVLIILLSVLLRRSYHWELGD